MAMKADPMDVLVLRRDLLLALALRAQRMTGCLDQRRAKAGAMCEVKRRELVAGTWDCKPQEYRNAVESFIRDGCRNDVAEAA